MGDAIESGCQHTHTRARTHTHTHTHRPGQANRASPLIHRETTQRCICSHLVCLFRGPDSAGVVALPVKSTVLPANSMRARTLAIHHSHVPGPRAHYWRMSSPRARPRLSPGPSIECECWAVSQRHSDPFPLSLRFSSHLSTSSASAYYTVRVLFRHSVPFLLSTFFLRGGEHSESRYSSNGLKRSSVVLSGHSNRGVSSQSLSAAESSLLERFCSVVDGPVVWCVFPPHLVLLGKMAESDRRSQIERVQQNDPTLTELRSSWILCMEFEVVCWAGSLRVPRCVALWNTGPTEG
jgi:hypothetical protein